MVILGVLSVRHVLETPEFSFVYGNNQYMLLYKKTHILRTSKPGRESAVVSMTPTGRTIAHGQSAQSPWPVIWPRRRDKRCK